MPDPEHSGRAAHDASRCLRTRTHGAGSSAQAAREPTSIGSMPANSLGELFTVTSAEYEAIHAAWCKALKVLPEYSVVHKQDWLIRD